MTEKLSAFYEKLSSDEAMQEELFEVLEDVEPEKQVPVVINYAKEKGFELSEEDFVVDEDVNLEELEAVSGGGGCGCAVAGGGGGDDLVCACFVVGKGRVKGYSKISSQGGCLCLTGGAGATRRH